MRAVGFASCQMLVGALAFFVGLGEPELGRSASPALADRTPLWQTLPATPDLPKPELQGRIPAGTASIWYAQYGLRHAGVPVLLLHGGLGSSRYYGRLIPFLLEKGFGVVVIDTRGHGRSTIGTQTVSYHLLAMDVIAVLDHLRLPKVDVVGWSDGGIIGIDLAVTRPERLHRLFAFGADASYKGLKPDYWNDGAFGSYMKRVKYEQQQISGRPESSDELTKAFQHAWDTEPDFSAADLSHIPIPVTIADGQYDEVMKPDHEVWMYQSIPNSNLIILPNVSHFALLQSPLSFNAAVWDFLRFR